MTQARRIQADVESEPQTSSGTRPWRLLVVAAVLVAAIVVAVALAVGSSRGSASPLLGRPAPALSGTTLDGRSLRAGTWGHGVTVVNIWASWCGPCRQEVPLIGRFARNAGPGVRVVTVDTRDGPEAARTLLRESHAEGLTTLQDPNGRIAVDWGATGVPETYVVDRHGLVRAHAAGDVTEAWLREQVHRWRLR